MRSLSLIFAFLFCHPTFAAKVDSVSAKSVTIFLQTLDDEDVQVGDLIYLTDGSGRRKATLKVTNNRGVMADTSVVSGSPSKGLKVQMPHEAKKVAAPVKKAPPKKAPPKKVVKRRPRPKPTPKPVAAPVVQPTPPVALPAPRPRPVKRPTRRGRPKPVVAEVKSEADDTEPAEEVSLEPPTTKDEASTPRKTKTSAQNAFDWNLSMDVLSLAGLLYDYQVFSFHAERRLSTSFSLGVSFNFGTFESNEGLDVIDKPLVRRTEYGGFLRYNFSGDIYESGIFAALAFKIAQENWVATPNFSEATDGGFVGLTTVGYQWMLRALSIRLGYAVQYSSLPREAEFESVTHTRTEDLLTGVSHYAVIQFGILF